MMRKIKPEKFGDMAEMPMAEAKRYPNFYISTKHLPEAKKWEVGQTYHIALEIKQTGISMHKDKENKEEGNADFEITAIEVLPNEGPKKKYEKVMRYKEEM